MGRPRKRGREDWPDGLTHRCRASGQIFYTYRGPLAAKEVYLGTDLKAAKRGITLLLKSKADDPVQRVIAAIERPTSTILQHATWYKGRLAERRSKTGKPMSTTTLYEYRRIVDDFTTQLKGSRSITDINDRDIAEILEALPPWASNRYRQIMRDFFRHACARGLRKDNPADQTIRRDTTRVRRRLPLEHFHKMREAADPWFQRVLDLAFWSLQREGDLVLLRADENWSDGVLRVRQSKGQRHGTGLLAIRPGEQLLAAIVTCLNSPERTHRIYDTCPYLLHRVPEKSRKAAWRVHQMQISGDMVSREFARVRDEVLNLYKGVAEGERPSFHEIRALGADHYRDVMKWPRDKIQALLGHTSEKMTRVYLDGHGDRWTEVVAA